ncbi:hypothetical protein [Agrobacterium tumefaciens]|uniref:hypothetical protein n=1 Tax=Agrobacterium tumefaciens TaxID=358 RepID=UPI00045A30B8|nr:hypothetical protein [Agrobacterium tumefaciens]CDN95006.1 hypothetical protein BN949_04178 [Agrobacterium tumefaciens]
MPILSDFVVKHLRPFSEDGYNTFGNKQTIEFLSSLSLEMDEITAIFTAWRKAALADPKTEDNLFAEAANAVAQARWEHLYETSKSTVMFLDDVQLESLSHLTPGKNRSFSWTAPTPIAIAVTIYKKSTRHDITLGATGFSGGTDDQGWISHFSGLLPPK